MVYFLELDDSPNPPRIYLLARDHAEAWSRAIDIARTLPCGTWKPACLGEVAEGFRREHGDYPVHHSGGRTLGEVMAMRQVQGNLFRSV